KEGQGMGAFLQYTVIGLTVGSFYALVALGYTIVYGIIRLINFAQGDLSMIGAFLGWTLLVGYGVRFLPLFTALVIEFVVPMLGTAVVNLAILEVAYKPLLNRSLLALLISALGMSLVLSNGAEWKWGPAIEAYPPSLLPSTGMFLGPVHVTYVQLALVFVSLLLMGGLVAFVQGTTLATAMRALAVDHDAARQMGGRDRFRRSHHGHRDQADRPVRRASGGADVTAEELLWTLVIVFLSLAGVRLLAYRLFSEDPRFTTWLNRVDRVPYWSRVLAFVVAMAAVAYFQGDEYFTAVMVSVATY